MLVPLWTVSIPLIYGEIFLTYKFAPNISYSQQLIILLNLVGTELENRGEYFTYTNRQWIFPMPSYSLERWPKIKRYQQHIVLKGQSHYTNLKYCRL